VSIEWINTLGSGGKTVAFWENLVYAPGFSVQGNGSIYGEGVGFFNSGTLVIGSYLSDSYPDVIGKIITHVSVRVVVGDLGGGHGGKTTIVGSEKFLPPNDSRYKETSVGALVIEDFEAELAVPVVLGGGSDFGGTLVQVGYLTGDWVEPYIHITRLNLGFAGAELGPCFWTEFNNTVEVCAPPAEGLVVSMWPFNTRRLQCSTDGAFSFSTWVQPHADWESDGVLFVDAVDFGEEATTPTSAWFGTTADQAAVEMFIAGGSCVGQLSAPLDGWTHTVYHCCTGNIIHPTRHFIVRTNIPSAAAATWSVIEKTGAASEEGAQFDFMGYNNEFVHLRFVRPLTGESPRSTFTVRCVYQGDTVDTVVNCMDYVEF
jgi:hypothetical protein